VPPGPAPTGAAAVDVFKRHVRYATAKVYWGWQWSRLAPQAGRDTWKHSPRLGGCAPLLAVHAGTQLSKAQAALAGLPAWHPSCDLGASPQ